MSCCLFFTVTSRSWLKKEKGQRKKAKRKLRCKKGRSVRQTKIYCAADLIDFFQSFCLWRNVPLLCRLEPWQSPRTHCHPTDVTLCPSVPAAAGSGLGRLPSCKICHIYT